MYICMSELPGGGSLEGAAASLRERNPCLPVQSAADEAEAGHPGGEGRGSKG